MFIPSNPGADTLFQLVLIPLIICTIAFGLWCIKKSLESAS